MKLKRLTSAYITIATAVISLLLGACSSDNDPKWDDLSIEQPITILRTGEGGSVKLYGGSSEYTVTNTNPNVASVEIETSEYAVRFGLQTIYVRGLAEGATVVSIIDNATGSTTALTIKVSQPYIGCRAPISVSTLDNVNEVFRLGTYLYFFKDGRFLLYNDPQPDVSIFALDGTQPEIDGEYALGEDSGGKYVTFSYVSTAHQITYKFYLKDNDAYEYLTTWPDTDYNTNQWDGDTADEWLSFTISMVSAYDGTRSIYLADSFIRLPYNIDL